MNGSTNVPSRLTNAPMNRTQTSRGSPRRFWRRVRRSESIGGRERLPIQVGRVLVLPPVGDPVVFQSDERDAVIGPRTAIGVLRRAHLLVGVEHDVMPDQRHGRRVVGTEELQELLAPLVALLVR